MFWKAGQTCGAGNPTLVRKLCVQEKEYSYWSARKDKQTEHQSRQLYKSGNNSKEAGNGAREQGIVGNFIVQRAWKSSIWFHVSSIEPTKVIKFVGHSAVEYQSQKGLRFWTEV